MKKVCYLVMALVAFQVNAQEAGKKGELLKNEVQVETDTNSEQVEITELITPDSETSKRSVSRSYGDQSIKKTRPEGEFSERRNPNYQWNYNYNLGYAEVFIRIPESGTFSIEIADQRISNSSGKFRFFDLRSGTHSISIYDRNTLVYRTRINVRNNSRMVLDYFSYKGLYLLETYNLRNNYANVWNDTWNNPYENNHGSLEEFSDDFESGSYYKNVMSDREFSSFIEILKKQGFDDGKLVFLRTQLNTTSFNTKQIKSIMRKLSFDQNRLEFAKMAYRSCLDKKNYFELYDNFDFDSYAKQLSEYIKDSF